VGHRRAAATRVAAEAERNSGGARGALLSAQFESKSFSTFGCCFE
jgi:hypothetical protein